jgi:Holliday junction resolvase-like predicted endonuclease
MSTRTSRRVAAECKECGKTFFAFKASLAIGQGKYCSQKCSMKARSRESNGIPNWIAGTPFGYVKNNPPVPGVDPKHYGALAEIIACEWLIRQGYELFRNISSHGLADFVAWKPGEAPIVIDVKTCGPRGHIRFVKPTQAQNAAGVRLLYVDRATRTVSFDRQDFGPFRPTPDHAARYRIGVERRGALTAPPPATSEEGPPSGCAQIASEGPLRAPER